MIFILKGDSVGARFGRSISFDLDIPSGIDTSGCSVRFSINGISCVSELVGRSTEIQLTSEQTDSLDLGVGFASVALVAGQDVCTVKNDLPVMVTDCVGDVQGASNSIDISLKGAWEDALEGINWDAGGSIASLRDFVARIGTALGASVETR